MIKQLSRYVTLAIVDQQPGEALDCCCSRSCSRGAGTTDLVNHTVECRSSLCTPNSRARARSQIVGSTDCIAAQLTRHIRTRLQHLVEPAYVTCTIGCADEGIDRLANTVQAVVECSGGEGGGKRAGGRRCGAAGCSGDLAIMELPLLVCFCHAVERCGRRSTVNVTDQITRKEAAHFCFLPHRPTVLRQSG